MDDAEHGENSSSPNVNITVTSVKKRAIGPFDRIELSDGSFFLIHPTFPPPFYYTEGINLSSDEIESLGSFSEIGYAWEKAVQLLERRNHSQQELKLKLRKKKFSGIAVDAVLERLVERNILDDSIFAEHWILSRLSRHPEGYYALLAGLLRKGVSGNIAKEVLEKVFTDETALDAVKRVWEKGKRKGKSEAELEKLLEKRGFRRHLVRRFLYDE